MAFFFKGFRSTLNLGFEQHPKRSFWLGGSRFGRPSREGQGDLEGPPDYVILNRLLSNRAVNRRKSSTKRKKSEPEHFVLQIFTFRGGRGRHVLQADAHGHAAALERDRPLWYGYVQCCRLPCFHCGCATPSPFFCDPQHPVRRSGGRFVLGGLKGEHRCPSPHAHM